MSDSDLNGWHKSRIRRFVQGVSGNFIGQAITFAQQILFIPLFLNSWGTQLYGEWLTLFASVSYLTMLEFGMHMYIVNRLTQVYARKAFKEYATVLHTALTISIALAGIAMALAVSIFPLAPIGKWFSFVMTNHSTAVLVVILLAFQLIVSIPQKVITGIYQSVGEFPRKVMIRNGQKALLLVLTGAVVLLGGKLIAIAAIQVIPLLGAIIYVLWDLQHRHPEIKLGFRDRDKKLAFSFFIPSALFFLMQLSVGLSVQGTVLIIGATLGAGNVVAFVTLRRLVGIIQQVVGHFNTALWPELTILEAQGRYSILRKVQLLTTKMLLLFVCCAAILLYFMGKDIVELWTLKKVVYDQMFVNIFLLYSFYLTFFRTSSVVLAASNNHKQASLCTFVSSFIGLILAYFFSLQWGLTGVVSGIFVADVLIRSWLIWLACRLIRQNFLKFVFEVIVKGIIVGVVSFVLASWVFRVLTLTPILLRFIIFGTVVGGICGILGYSLWLNKNEKTWIIHLIRKFIPTIAHSINIHNLFSRTRNAK